MAGRFPGRRPGGQEGGLASRVQGQVGAAAEGGVGPAPPVSSLARAPTRPQPAQALREGLPDEDEASRRPWGFAGSVAADTCLEGTSRGGGGGQETQRGWPGQRRAGRLPGAERSSVGLRWAHRSHPRGDGPSSSQHLAGAPRARALSPQNNQERGSCWSRGVAAGWPCSGVGGGEIEGSES